MALINNPGLREIALRIVSDSGFSTHQEGMRRALRQWFEAVTPQQREAAEQALIIRWLEDVHAEYWRERNRQRTPAVTGSSVPNVVVGTLAEDDKPGDTAAPLSVLKFQSESPDWRKPEVTVPARPAAPPARRAAAVPPPAPVTVTQVADEPAPPGRAPVPVQQPSRKVASYQQMFPELAFRVQAPSGAKSLAEFTAQDIAFRRGELARQRQVWRTASAGDESRIEERERLNAKDRVRVAERARNIRDAEAEEQRLKLAEHEIEQYEVASIGELPPEALAACGFKRRVA